MPRLLLYAAICAFAVYVYRSFRRPSGHVNRQLRRRNRARVHGTLVRDPKTGEYRLERD